MGMLANMRGKCDDCGQEEESTAITFFLIVSDMTPDSSGVRNLLYCRRNGCAQALIPDSPGLLDAPEPPETDEQMEAAATSEDDDPDAADDGSADDATTASGSATAKKRTSSKSSS